MSYPTPAPAPETSDKVDVQIFFIGIAAVCALLLLTYLSKRLINHCKQKKEVGPLEALYGTFDAYSPAALEAGLDPSNKKKASKKAGRFSNGSRGRINSAPCLK